MYLERTLICEAWEKRGVPDLKPAKTPVAGRFLEILLQAFLQPLYTYSIPSEHTVMLTNSSHADDYATGNT